VRTVPPDVVHRASRVPCALGSGSLGTEWYGVGWNGLGIPLDRVIDATPRHNPLCLEYRKETQLRWHNTGIASFGDAQAMDSSEAPVEGVELGFLESSLGRSLECGAR
jgi:hypothetical protein